LKNCDFTFADDAEAGYAAMMDDTQKLCKAGLIFNHVKSVVMDNVKLTDVIGEEAIFNDVGKVGVDHVD